jgi:hypothetical protein
MTAPDPACEQAFDIWLAGIPLPWEAVNASAVDDVAHEAFCSGWNASRAEPDEARLRIAELERLADEMLAAFGDNGSTSWRISASAEPATVARWQAIRHSGERAAEAADELSRPGVELQGGDR